MRSLRWLFTILALALLGILAYLLWPRPGGARRLVALPIWATDQLVVASQPYVREDIDALGELANSLADHDDVQFHWSRGMQDARSFANLDAELRGMTKADDDLLMLYVSAHGVSDRGESGDWSAYLVFSDYMRMGQGGRHPIGDFLDDVRSAESKMKLVALDAGRIAYDPRLGVVANEFPRLVESELRKLGEEDLWVLLPAGSLERAAVSHPLKRSVFGLSVAEALSGNADQWPKDHFVSLYELYRYVFEKCANWYDPDTGAAQTPLLMKAGKGIVEPEQDTEGDEAHHLIWVRDKEAPEESEAETVPEDQETEKPPDEASDLETSSLPHWVLSTRYGVLQTGAETPADAKPAANAEAKGDSKPTDDRIASPDEKPPGEKEPVPASAAKEKKTPSEPVADKAKKKPDSTEGKDSFNEMVTRLRSHVHEAWMLRDALHDPQTPEARSPAEFAPHLWRQVNALLLYYERRCRAGRPVQADQASDGTSGQTMAELVASASALVDDLRRLQTLIGGDTEPSSQKFKHSVCGRLADSWRRYVQTGQTGDEGEMSELKQLRNATRQYRRLLFSAVYYVRWHAEASITSSSHRVPLYSEIENLLDELLRFKQTLVTLEEAPVEISHISKLVDALKECRSLQSRSSKIDGLLAVRETTAIANIQRPIHQQEAEDLLSTPLLSAPRRKRLLDELLSAASNAGAGQTGDVAFPRSATATPKRWQRLLDRLRLEEKLIRLANPDAADSLRGPISDIDGLLKQLPDSEEQLWLTCRGLGTGLRDIYAGLPDGADYYALHLIDPRDTAKDAFGVARSHPLPVFGVTVEQPVLIRLAGPTQERLDKGKAKPLTFTVSASKRELITPLPTPRLQYDDKHMAVSGPDAGPIEAADGWFHAELTWHVEARMDQDKAGARETDLTLTVPWTDGPEDKQASHTANLTLPQPNRIDLEVIRIGASKHQPDSGATVVLELFPNRKTRYQFTLVNHSGLAKQVAVALYAIPPQPSATIAPGRIGRRLREIVLDDVTGILNADLIAKTSGPVQLSTDSTARVPINFGAKSSGAEGKPGDEGGGKPENKPKPPASIAHTVSHGLVCVVTDAAPPNVRWIKWIEVVPIAPRRYLDPTIGYDYDTKQIIAKLQPKDFDDDGKPDLPPGEPVDVAWNDYYGQIPDEATKRLGGQIDAPDALLELYAGVFPDNAARTVSLTVDRYSRAFVYQVPCNRQRPIEPFRRGSDVRRTDRRIRINSISAAGYPTVFHFSPYVAYPTPEELEKDKERKHLKIAADQPIVVPAPCSSLRVDFEADAPVDAFADPDHRIEVTLGEDLTKPVRVFDDRSMTTQLVEFGDRGLMEFETEVGDYSVELLPGDLENEKTYVEAELLLPGIGQASDHVVLVLDSDKPSIQEMGLTIPGRRGAVPVVDRASEIPKGATVIVHIQARDLSGVAAVEYTFAARGKREMDPESATKNELLDVRSADLTHVFDLRLETQDLSMGEHALLVRLADKVGHQSEVLAHNIRIVAAQPKPQKGVISGAIRFGPNRVQVSGLLFTATIKGPKIGVQPIAVKPDGTFFIKDLPPGSYTISTQGSFLGRVAEGSAEDVQPSPPDSIDSILVIVDRKKP